MSKPAKWFLEEADTGLTVASGAAPTPEEASGHAVHYAIQYAQDGPVRWRVKQGNKTVSEGNLSIVGFRGKLAG